MTPIDFRFSNHTFQKPEGWTDEQCTPLPVHIHENNEFPGIISCWKLSEEDLQRINETGVVWLNVVGRTMPPVLLFTENPFPEL